MDKLEFFCSSSEWTVAYSGASKRDEPFRIWVALQGKKGLSGEQMEEEVAITQGIY